MMRTSFWKLFVLAALGVGTFWLGVKTVPMPEPVNQLCGPQTSLTQIRQAGVPKYLAWLAVTGWIVSMTLAVGQRLSRRQRKVWSFRLASAVLGMIFVFLAGELTVRALGIKPLEYIPANIYDTYDFKTPGAVTRYIGYVPNGVKEFEVEVRLNSAGWRDHEYPQQKPAGTRRIVVIGDSYIAGNEVALEQTVSKQLEAALNSNAQSGMRWEVLAMGLGGVGTVDELRTLKNHALLYDPDLVILAFFPGNDVVNNHPDLEYQVMWERSHVYHEKVVAPRIAAEERWLWFSWSRLNALIVERIAPAVGRMKSWIWPEAQGTTAMQAESDPRYPEAWKRTTEALLEFRDLTRDAGAELLVALVYSRQEPSLYSSSQSGAQILTLDSSWLHRVMTRFCAQNEMECLDLEPVLKNADQAGAGSWHWRYDLHWNERGHRLAAEALEKWVRSHPEKWTD